MNKDAGAQKYAIMALRTVSLGYIFYGLGMVMMNAFNGAGDTKTPTAINLVCFWAFQIPFAWLLTSHWKLGPQGVFIAIVVTETLVCIVSTVMFVRGKWKIVMV
jgi:Na+-driven multidrug efflux pump